MIRCILFIEACPAGNLRVCMGTFVNRCGRVSIIARVTYNGVGN